MSSNLRVVTLSLSLACAVGLSGCATNNSQVDEWIPITDSDSTNDPKVQLARKYGVPEKDHLYDGLTFWKESPLLRAPTVAFHWYGDSFTLWRQRGEAFDLEKHKIVVSSCAGLRDSLNVLLLTIGDDARNMTDPTKYSDHVYVDGLIYSMKYMSEIGGTMRIESSQFDPVTWPAAAENAMSIGNKCVLAQPAAPPDALTRAGERQR